jgi:hypothetical protein
VKYLLGQKQNSTTNTLREGFFTLSWTDDGTKSTRFSLETRTNESNYVWSGFGLSDDQKMVIQQACLFYYNLNTDNTIFCIYKGKRQRYNMQSG